MKYFLVVIILVPAISHAVMLSERDKLIVKLIVMKHELNSEQTALLIAIRLQENGTPGRECGYEMPIARYYREPTISTYCQMDGLAWTIKQRYNGSIDEFARKYHNGDAKSNKHWASMVKKYYRIYYAKAKR
jgi:hypothetical protein